MQAHILVTLGAAALLLGSSTPTRADQKLNKPPKGFNALFNSKDLTHWHGLVELPERRKLTPEQLQQAQAKADEQMRQHWTVRSGILLYDGKGNSLQTAKDYGDFEMWVDWKIEKAGDSGIYLRGNPQVQIWDNPVGSGGLYNNKKHAHDPLVVADNPIGEWNTFWIKMVGDRVTVKFNGKLVVDDTPLENYWFPDEPLPSVGPLELQHHGSHLEFRNIFVKELPRHSGAPPPGGRGPVASSRVPAQAPRVTLTLDQTRLSDALRLVAAQSNMNVVLLDPSGKLGDTVITFMRLNNTAVEAALKKVCIAAGADCMKDRSGVFFISEHK